MRRLKPILSAVLALGMLFLSTAVLPASAIFSSRPEPVRHRIFMGDSRTVGMYSAVHGGNAEPVDAVNGNEYWIAKTSQGYKWMTETAIPKAEDYGISQNTEVFILFGVNDLGNQKKYLSTINEKASQWRQQGARVYFVSVNPVYDGKSRNVKNEAIERFNSAMKSGLSSSVTYIDTYSTLVPEIAEDPSKTDRLGIHYHEDTYQEIYNILLGY